MGVRGNSYLGDISLDEVSVSDAEECKNLEPKQGDVETNPQEGEFAICSDYGQPCFVERCLIISPNGLIQSGHEHPAVKLSIFPLLPSLSLLFHSLIYNYDKVKRRKTNSWEVLVL